MVPVSVLKAAGVKTEVELRPYLWAGLEKVRSLELSWIQVLKG